jgi:hypothetical protein
MKKKIHSIALDSRIADYALEQCIAQHRSLRNWVHMAIANYIKTQQADIQQTQTSCNVTPTQDDTIQQPTVVSHTTPQNTTNTNIPQPTIIKPIPRYIDEDVEGDEPFVEFDWDNYPSKP